MKIGVSITAFREKDIVPLIKHYEGSVDRIVVTVSRKSWYGDQEGDDTAERAVRDTDAIVVQKHWETEADQRNYAMDLMRDMDYVITSHADTFFTKSDLKELKNLELVDLHYGCNVKMYWKDFDHIVYPMIGLPTLIVRSDVVFTNILNIENQMADPKILPITCHHLSWIKTDEEVKKKISTYSHADEIQKDWFERVWKNWKSDMTNFAPTNPADYQRVLKDPCPEEIRRLFHE